VTLRQFEYIGRIARELSDTPGGSGSVVSPELSAVRLDALLASRLDQFTRVHPRAEVTFSPNLGDGAVVEGDPQLLQMTLDFLLENAGRAMVDRPVAKLEITTIRRGEIADVTITDTGPGIPADILPLLFKQRIEGSGMGMGLLLVHVIMEKHKGAVELVSSDERGTVIRLQVPLQSAP
jgi:signal transduction histidine kinase